MIHRKSIQVEAIGDNAFRKSYGLHGFNSYAKSISSRQIRAKRWEHGGVIFQLEMIDGELKLNQAITNLGFRGVKETDWDEVWSKSLL